MVDSGTGTGAPTALTAQEGDQTLLGGGSVGQQQPEQQLLEQPAVGASSSDAVEATRLATCAAMPADVLQAAAAAAKNSFTHACQSDPSACPWAAAFSAHSQYLSTVQMLLTLQNPSGGGG